MSIVCEELEIGIKDPNFEEGDDIPNYLTKLKQ